MLQTSQDTEYSELFRLIECSDECAWRPPTRPEPASIRNSQAGAPASVAKQGEPLRGDHGDSASARAGAGTKPAVSPGAAFHRAQTSAMTSSTSLDSNRNTRPDDGNEPPALSRRRAASGLSPRATMHGKLWYAVARLQVTMTSAPAASDSSASSTPYEPSEAMITIVPSGRRADRADAIDAGPNSAAPSCRNGSKL